MKHAHLVALATVAATAACGGTDVTDPDPTDFSLTVQLQRLGNTTSDQPVSIRWIAPSGRNAIVQGAVGATATINVPEAGSYTVELTELPDHCFTEADESTTSVADGVPGSTSFDVTCIGGFAHVYNNNVLAYRSLSGAVVEHTFGGGAFPFEWDPTGRYLLVRKNDLPTCPLSVFDVESGGVTEVAGSTAGYAGPEPVWAPDGSRFAALRTGNCSTNGTGDAVVLIDAATAMVVDSIPGLSPAPGIAWGPTSSRTTYTTGSEIRWHDWDTGADSLFATMAEAPQTLAWSPQNDLLAAIVASGADFFLRIFDADGTELATFGGAGSSFDRLRWSPDGTLLAFSTNGGGGTTVVDRTGTEVFTLARNGGFAAFPHWAPDSGSLLFTANDGGLNYIGWVDADGNGRRALTDDTADDDEPRWAGSSSIFLHHSEQTGGLAVILGNVDGSLRVSVSALARSGFPRWRPEVSLQLN